VEGGGIINWYFVKHGLADEVIVTVAPYLVGGQSAASLIRGAGFPSIADSARLRLRSVSRFKDEVVLEYAIRQKRAA
jgi:riboflavin biosynthesis pyrimidine reductase